jgi:hypothetical protein
MATAEVHELNTYIPVLDTHYPTFASRHDYETIHLKDRFDSRDTSKQFHRSVEGQASKVWSKLPQDVLQKGQVDGWQSITKDCQRFLTRKPTNQKTKNEKQNNKQANKLNITTVSSLTSNSKGLNNELNVKLDFNSIITELRLNGIHFK